MQTISRNNQTTINFFIPNWGKVKQLQLIIFKNNTIGNFLLRINNSLIAKNSIINIASNGLKWSSNTVFYQDHSWVKVMHILARASFGILLKEIKYLWQSSIN